MSFTSGAGNDLEQASALATQMITRLGMGKDPSLRVIDDQSNLSPERRREVDAAIDQRLSDAQEQARVIIENELPLLKSIAKALLEEDTLDRERFLEIIEHEGN